MAKHFKESEKLHIGLKLKVINQLCPALDQPSLEHNVAKPSIRLRPQYCRCYAHDPPPLAIFNLDRMAQTILRQIKHSPKGTTPKFKRDQWGSKGASTRTCGPPASHKILDIQGNATSEVSSLWSEYRFHCIGASEIAHWPDPTIVVVTPSCIVELAYVRVPSWRSNS